MVKQVEERIKEAYAGPSNGSIWVVEKGKEKECRLLKEAVERIESLKRKNDRLQESERNLSRQIEKIEKHHESAMCEVLAEHETIREGLADLRDEINEFLKRVPSQQF